MEIINSASNNNLNLSGWIVLILILLIVYFLFRKVKNNDTSLNVDSEIEVDSIQVDSVLEEIDATIERKPKKENKLAATTTSHEMGSYKQQQGRVKRASSKTEKPVKPKKTAEKYEIRTGKIQANNDPITAGSIKTNVKGKTSKPKKTK